MIDQKLKDQMQQTLDMAKSRGVDQADLILSKSKSLAINSSQGEVDKFKVSGAQAIGVRVIKNNRVGISYTEKIDQDSLGLMVDKAVENARNSDVDEFETIDEHAKSIVVENNAQIYKHDTHITTQEKIDLCLKLESEVKDRDNRVKSSPYNGVSDSEYQHYYLNSSGAFSFQEERSVNCYTSALMQEGDMNSMYYHSAVARSFDVLNWEECVDESLKHASHFLQGRPISSGSYDVFFDHGVLSSLFGCFSNIFSAKAAYEKVNPLADKLDQVVASEKLNIWDLPTFDKSFVYSPFDDEGFARSDLQLIGEGKLLNLCHNTATAKYFKTNTNARGSRSLRSPLGVGTTTLVIDPAENEQIDLFQDEYILIQQVSGLHAGTNPYSGDFSLEATGYLMRDGEIVQTVKGVTVGGNFFEMLKNISLIGNKLFSNSSKTFFTPWIRFSGLKIAGQ